MLIQLKMSYGTGYGKFTVFAARFFTSKVTFQPKPFSKNFDYILLVIICSDLICNRNPFSRFSGIVHENRDI